jgi:hypothetical protein
MLLNRRFALMGLTLLTGHRALAALPPPSGKKVLSITGRIGAPNQGTNVVFDMPMLESLGLVTLRTTTPWFTGEVAFEGVPMTTLMEAIGASGDKLMVYALNDYTTEIPMADFAKYKPILAVKRDGRYMPVSDKGPLFIVYPFDSSAELKSQKFYSRSAWQIARMEVV